MTTHDLKVQRIIEQMGERYCCHKSRQVKRLAEPLSDSRGVDVRKTFMKATEKYERGGK